LPRALQEMQERSCDLADWFARPAMHPVRSDKTAGTCACLLQADGQAGSRPEAQRVTVRGSMPRNSAAPSGVRTRLRAECERWMGRTETIDSDVLKMNLLIFEDCLVAAR